MYAVIRAGGKQYRVSPGDVVRIEKLPASQGDTIEFNDVLAVSSGDGKIGPGTDVMVSGEVMEGGRADKILVFHFKRKKQYKKMYGHRQPYTAVRITEIAFDGQRFTAPRSATQPESFGSVTGKPAHPLGEAREVDKSAGLDLDQRSGGTGRGRGSPPPRVRV